MCTAARAALRLSSLALATRSPGPSNNRPRRPRMARTTRKGVNRAQSNRKFTKRAGQTHSMNVARPLRGGIRL